MSLHLIMGVPVCIDNKMETKTVEIQIRTTAMDFWSVLEYQLLYKKNVKGADKIGKELKEYSEEIASLDRKMLNANFSLFSYRQVPGRKDVSCESAHQEGCSDP